ncbi:MAG: site-specific integrase [Clostridiales bacterium]|nr:site-specific integrase [Clostridiales bacterium]
MDKDFIRYKLGIMANAVSSIFEQTNTLKNEICTMLGFLKADDDFGNGFDNQMEKINQMIIKLNIKGSTRVRSNGLIELRTAAFGSIYGRTAEEVEQKLTEKIKELTTKPKTLNKGQTPTLSEFYNDIYLQHKEQTVSANFLRSIRSSFKQCVDGGLDKPLNKLSTVELEKFLMTIEKARTRQVVRGFLFNLFEYAKQLGTVKINPCENVSAVKYTKNIGKAFSFKEQEEFFTELYKAKNIPTNKKLYYTFVYLTGTRRSEAISLNVSNVDFETNILHIPGTKTKNSNRDMPLFPLVKELLLRITPTDAGRYFTLEQAKATQVIKKVTSDHHLHELRHTFGTIAICVKKLDAKTVALYMGHADATMTLNIYTHPEQLDKELFFNGALTEEEKLAIMRQRYSGITDMIAEFLNSIPKSYPN